MASNFRGAALQRQVAQHRFLAKGAILLGGVETGFPGKETSFCQLGLLGWLVACHLCCMLVLAFSELRWFLHPAAVSHYPVSDHGAHRTDTFR